MCEPSAEPRLGSQQALSKGLFQLLCSSLSLVRQRESQLCERRCGLEGSFRQTLEPNTHFQKETPWINNAKNSNNNTYGAGPRQDSPHFIYWPTAASWPLLCSRYYSHCPQRRKRGTERLSNWLEVTEVVSVGIRIQIQAVWLQGLTANTPA